jgi:hypothetical protein
MELIIWISVGTITGWIASLSSLYNVFHSSDRRKRDMYVLNNVIISVLSSIVGGLILHLADKQNLDFGGQILNTNLSSELTRFDLVTILISIIAPIISLVVIYSIKRNKLEMEDSDRGEHERERLSVA